MRLLLLLLLFAPALSATVALKLDLETLTDKAEVIVRAKIDTVDARWNAANTAIWTHHACTVSSTLKGDAKANVTFLTRGGVVGNKLKRFAPRRVKLDKPIAKAPARLPANAALEPTQRTLF